MPSLDHAIYILGSGAVHHDWQTKGTYWQIPYPLQGAAQLSTSLAIPCNKLTSSQLEHPRSIIILQHGFTEYAEKFVHSYHNIIPRFQDAGLRVPAIDQCGHGRALGDRGVLNVEKAVQGVLEVRMRALEGTIGLADRLRLFLFGHGLGGLISIGSVLTDARHIDGVILTSPALPLPKSSLATRTLGFTAKLLPRATIASRSSSPVQGLPPRPDEDPHVFQDDYEPTKV